jgi:hypothetical protein
VQRDGQPPRALVRGPDGLHATAAGHFAAVAAARGTRASEPTSVTVYDLDSGESLFSLTLPREPGIAVAADGTLFVALDGVLQWASPAAPDLHEIARSVRQIGPVFGGTALFTATTGGGFERIRAVDRATDAVRDVTPAFVIGPGQDILTVWDGAHFAYDDGECLLVGDLPAAPAASIPTSPDCPRPPLGTSARVAAGHRAVSAVARCPGGTADRCSGTARLQARIGRRLRTLATRSFALAGGQSAALRLAPSRARLRRVKPASRRHPHDRRVRLEIRPAAGGVDLRFRDFTLHA